MGAIATRMLGVALLKWVRLTARSIVAPRLIEFALKSNVDYTGANANNLITDLTNIVAKYGATMPPQADITGYQNAVQALATILNDFKAQKQDFDIFKNTMAQLIKGKMIFVPTATRQIIATRVGHAMNWGANPQTVGSNFNTQIFVPLNQLFTTLGGTLPLAQGAKIGAEYRKLAAPLAVALYTNAMLN